MNKPKESRPHYIYVLKNKRTGEIRYVGQTVDPLKKRLSNHLSEKGNTYKCKWIESLKKDGVKPTIALIQEIPAGEDWQYWERFWIKLYRDLGYRLVNATDGGEGTADYTHSQERRDHQSKVMAGRKPSSLAFERARQAHMKPIARYTRKGKFVDKWDSATAAGRELDINIDNIRDAANLKIPTAGDYMWRDWEETEGADIEPYVNKREKPVARYTSDDVFIDEWESASKAGRALDIQQTGINRCVKGLQETAGDFKWKYCVDK